MEYPNHQLRNSQGWDLTMLLANIVEVMKNVSSKTLEKNDMNKIVEEAVTKGIAIVRTKMQTMETRLTTQTKMFATYATDKTAKAFKMNKLIIELP